MRTYSIVIIKFSFLSAPIVDMVKGLDKGTSIENVRIVSKTGGKSGDWHRAGEPA